MSRVSGDEAARAPAGVALTPAEAMRRDLLISDRLGRRDLFEGVTDRSTRRERIRREINRQGIASARWAGRETWAQAFARWYGEEL